VPSRCLFPPTSRTASATRLSSLAETIRLAGQTGLVGCSIEDATGEKDKPLYDLGQASERVAAVAEATRAAGFGFLLTARSENFFRGNPDLDDTIKRLQAYENAGADVLMAPRLPGLAAVRQVCSSLSKPFNFMAGIKNKSFTAPALAEAGVRRNLPLPGGRDRADCGRDRTQRERHVRLCGHSHRDTELNQLLAGVK
jgi:2-methylisocitrate lyase-like PEP mutase family enzyme